MVALSLLEFSGSADVRLIFALTYAMSRLLRTPSELLQRPQNLLPSALPDSSIVHACRTYAYAGSSMQFRIASSKIADIPHRLRQHRARPSRVALSRDVRQSEAIRPLPP